MDSLFGDKRLARRWQKLQMALLNKPRGCLSQVLSGWSELKAGYHFLK